MAAQKNTKKLNSSEEKRNQWLQNMKKSYGGTPLIKANQIVAREVISTGYEGLDKILGTGGFPIGCVMELFGIEASGKGVLSMKLCKAAQEAGKKCLWIDLEHQANASWMETNGLDTSKLDVLEPFWAAEEVLTELNNAINTGHYSLIVVDSVAALEPKHDFDNDVGQTQVGRLAKVMSDAMKKVTKSCAEQKCTALFINQTREKIGVMYGNPTTTPGGKALGFYASIRLGIAKVSSEKIFQGEEIIGCGAKIKTEKNRFFIPQKDTIIPIYYIKYDPTPIDKLVSLAKDKKVIRKYKGQYKFNKIHEAEKLEELFEVIYFNDVQNEFAEELLKVLKAEDEVISDPEMLQALEEMKSGDFDYSKYKKEDV